jgi:hypothetical protein
LEERHKMRVIHMVEDRAAMDIQKRWHMYKEAKRQKVVAAAFGLIRHLIMKVWHSFLMRQGCSYAKKEGKAYCFQHDPHISFRWYHVTKLTYRLAQKANGLMKTIKQYRSNVIQCQLIANAFFVIRNARLHCISIYWFQCCPLWWAGRNTPDKTKSKKDKKAQEAQLPAMVQIREGIKDELIQSDYATVFSLINIIYRGDCYTANRCYPIQQH